MTESQTYSKNWISLNRKITQNWIWEDKPFSRGQAWIDLLLCAWFDDGTAFVNSCPLEVKRGQVLTSEKKLMARWGWSKSKVRRFLSVLETDTMIDKKTDTKKTIITILNYDTYQYIETTKKPKKNHEKTTKELQKDTDNKITNNEEQDNNKYTNELFIFCQELPLVKKIPEQITNEEYSRLIQKYSIQELKEIITELGNYRGGKYQSVNLTIQKWLRDRKPKTNSNGSTLPTIQDIIEQQSKMDDERLIELKKKFGEEPPVIQRTLHGN